MVVLCGCIVASISPLVLLISLQKVLVWRESVYHRTVPAGKITGIVASFFET
jgi:hypothetical protein